MHFRSGIEINNSFFIPFTKHNTFTLGKIYIISIKQNHFTNTHSRRCQHINHSQITLFTTVITHTFKIFVSICLFYSFTSLYLVYPSYRALYDIIFIFQPPKKCGKNTPNIIYGHLAWLVPLLIICQVFPKIICRNMPHCFIHCCQEFFYSALVIGEWFFRPSLNTFRRKKQFNIIWFLRLCFFFRNTIMAKVMLQHILQCFLLPIVQMGLHLS